MAFTHCILFTCYTREQNTTCKGHLAFQKATISLENDVHSFFFLPLTFITINVRHIQYYAHESVIAKITFEVSRIFCDLSSNVLFVMRIPVTNLFPVWKMRQSISRKRIFSWHLKRHNRTVHEKKPDFTCNEYGKSFG